METYTQLRLPQGFNEVPNIMPTVSILMNCLCFTHYSKGNDFVIWQMREFGVEDTWTQLFKFSYQHQRCTGLRNGYCSLLPLHVLDNDDTLILANGEELICYNRRENRLVKLPRINEFTNWLYARHYVESLVQLVKVSSFQDIILMLIHVHCLIPCLTVLLNNYLLFIEWETFINIYSSIGRWGKINQVILFNQTSTYFICLKAFWCLTESFLNYRSTSLASSTRIIDGTW